MNRGKSLALFSILVVAIYWWFWPDDGRLRREDLSVHQTTFSSQPSTAIPAEEAPSDKGSPNNASPARVVKSVGAHQGRLIQYRSRRSNRSGGNQPKDQTTGRDATPMDRYKGFSFSSPVTINNHKHLILNARAVAKDSYRPYMGDIAFEQDGFIFIQDKQDNFQDLVIRAGDRPVVVNPGNGRVGIVTGTLVVKLNDIRQAEIIAGRERLELLHSDEATGVAYYRAPENYQLLRGADSLKKDKNVMRVELEIVQGKRDVR